MSMIPVVLMVVGGGVWLIGELLGVFFTKTKTTSNLIWLLEKRWPLLRILVAVFVISLGFHFELGTWLLP